MIYPDVRCIGVKLMMITKSSETDGDAFLQTVGSGLERLKNVKIYSLLCVLPFCSDVLEIMKARTLHKSDRNRVFCF